SVLTYQPSTIRAGKVTGLDLNSVHPSVAGYTDPFPAISGIPTDLPGLDFLSLVSVDSQYYPPMFLDSLNAAMSTNRMPGKQRTLSSHHESSAREAVSEENILRMSLRDFQHIQMPPSS
ncbi:hypothetical protein GDO86_018392, partial [Hymenochirus boettgeri]